MMLEARLTSRSLLFNIDRYTNIVSAGISFGYAQDCHAGGIDQNIFDFFFGAYSGLHRSTRTIIKMVLAVKTWALIRRPEPTSLVISTAHWHH